MPNIKPEGLLLANSSAVSRRNYREDLLSYWIDAQTIADSLGASKVANLVLLGAYLQKKALLDWEAIVQGLNKMLDGKAPELIQLNLTALEEGKKWVLKSGQDCSNRRYCLFCFAHLRHCERVDWIAPVIIKQGEEELFALAEGALRVLKGEDA